VKNWAVTNHILVFLLSTNMRIPSFNQKSFQTKTFIEVRDVS